ncbi:intercompartmental signaling factor BofC [Bacillus spongiae]|uniref:Intercompartmental signaling factor BofC n=1 Tax=Bacillus spongiae TaxID=2683610 RepID=A0ABU8H924_9BACI
MIRAFRILYMSLLIVTITVFNLDQSVCGATDSQANTEKHDSTEVAPAHQITVILERLYLDGESSKEVVTKTIWSMEDFWSEYEKWNLVEMNEEVAIFQQQMNDISPLLKSNGYFGITEGGVLTIFNGKPDKSNVIQSFFQIDIPKLESKTQKELVKGIPIKSKEEYNEVLDVFKPYKKNR